MLQAALRSRARPTAGASSRLFAAAAARRAGATASWPGPAGCSRRSRTSGSTTRSSTFLRRRAVVDGATSTGWPTTASPATSAATPRARSTSPARRVLVVESTFAEGVVLETLVLSILNHDTAIASAASRMTLRGRRPAVHRDGLPPHARGGRRRGRPRRVHRRLRRDLATSRPAAATGCPRPAPRPTPSRCCTTRSARPSRPRSQPRARARPCSSTPTTSPRPCAPRSRWPGRSSARSASTRATCCELARQVRAQLDVARRHRHPDRGHVRPRRVRDRRARGGAGRRLRRRDPAGHRLGRTRRAGIVYKLVSRSDDVGASWCRWRRGATDKTSVGGRKWALRRLPPTGWRRPRSSVSERRPRTTGTTAPLLVAARA